MMDCSINDKGLVKDTLYADIEQFQKLYQQQLKRRDEPVSELSKRNFTDEAIVAARQFREDLLMGLDNPSFEDKQRTLELLNVKITIHNQIAQVTCRISSQNGREPCIIELEQIKIASDSATGFFSQKTQSAYSSR